MAPQTSLDKAVYYLGKTDWYSVLHYHRLLKILELVCKRAPAGSVGLEIGAWPGYLGLALHYCGFKEIGVDLDSTRLKKLGFPVSNLNLNIEPLPFSDNTFDFATFSEVVEHLENGRTLKVFAEIRRVLKPGGFLFITTPNKFRFGVLFGKNTTHADSRGHGHEFEYTLEEMIRSSKASGFEIEKAATISFYAGVGKAGRNQYFYPLIGFLRHANRVRNLIKIFFYPILKFFPSLRDSMYLVLKKD